MKHLLLFFAIVTTLFIACGKKDGKPAITTTPAAPETKVATKEIQIEGSKLRLPIGTRITLSADGYELQVELPEGYSFLTSESSLAKNVDPMPIFVPATYKCQCSADNACQVFYQEDLGGFGCIHKSCSGSCTGSFTVREKEITGILNNRNPELSARNDVFYEKASLTSRGWEDFFNNTTVQEIIAEQYEKMYAKIPAPDFKKLKTGSLEKYVFLKVNLYGVPFYMLAPKEMAAYKDYVKTIPASKAECKCSSEKGACQKKSWTFLKIWEAFWCEGDCSACELTVSSATSNLVGSE